MHDLLNYAAGKGTKSISSLTDIQRYSMEKYSTKRNPIIFICAKLATDSNYLK